MAIAPGFVAVTYHFSGVGVEFGMCGEGGGLDLAVKVVASDCFESDGVESERGAVFFHGEQDASPEDNVGV